MKGILITILALVAAPALAAEVDLSKVYRVTSLTQGSGGIAARAAKEVENAALAARQNVQFCKLPPSVFVGNPGGATPANLDGKLTPLFTHRPFRSTDLLSRKLHFSGRM